MSKVYCQNELYKNYGRCKKQEVFMTWQPQDEYEVFKEYLITGNATIFTPEHSVITGKIKALEWVLEVENEK